MPRNSKPRKPYRPKPGASAYPDLHDIGLIFRPIHRLFEQLRSGEVDSWRGRPIFTDWQGDQCEAAPALEGWADCWQRVSDGEHLSVELSATRKLAAWLKHDVPLTLELVEAAYQEMIVTQRLTMRITRAKMAEYMRVEQIQIEIDRLGVRDASA